MSMKMRNASAAKKNDTTKGKTDSSVHKTGSTETFQIDLADRFEFYARIVKLKILRNDDMDVKSKYSTWLSALKTCKDDELKHDYIRLMVMGLNYTVPVCPFNEYPPAEIEPIDCEWRDAARNIFFRDECRPVVINPPIITAVSEDRCRFAAYQTIPNAAGVQCFYAQSDEPLYEWNFKYDSITNPPEEPVHARSLDWERSLAGIRKIPKTSSLDMFDYNEIKLEDPCSILVTEQEKINVTDEFKWNEKSVLTGETIPGSEMCTDWLFNEHNQSQMDIDEQMANSFDKLYPDNFRLLVSPKLMEGIADGMKNVARDNRGGVENTDVEGKPQIRKFPCSAHRQFAGKDRNSATALELWTDHFASRKSSEDNGHNRTPQTIIYHHPNDEADKSSSTYAESVKSFKSMANKADDIVKQVNDWLHTSRYKRSHISKG